MYIFTEIQLRYEYICVWYVSLSLLIHSPLDDLRDTGLFHVLTIVNTAAMNTGDVNISLRQ